MTMFKAPKGRIMFEHEREDLAKVVKKIGRAHV